MYGENPKEVESHLATIPWLPHSTHTVVRVTRVNGVDRQLEAVSAELDQLPPEEKKYVLKTGGTFNWRPIAGSEQLSAHAFGIAIDIDPDYSDYWRWNADGRSRKTDSLQEPDSTSDCRDFRATRLYLGRQVVSLRHDAF